MRTDLWMFLVGGCALVLWLETPHVWRTVVQDLKGPYPNPEPAVAGTPEPVGVQSARGSADPR